MKTKEETLKTNSITFTRLQQEKPMLAHHILKAMDEYANQEKEKAEKRNVELVEELITALSALLEICELFPNSLLHKNKIKLFKGKIQALKNNKHQWAVLSESESDIITKKVNKLAQTNNSND